MTQVTDFTTYRNGGIEFTVAGTSIDGRYSILHPGWPKVSIARDGLQLPADASENADVTRLLDDWVHEHLTQDAIAALSELDALREWRNLPDRLSRFVLLHRIRWVLQRLRSSEE